MDSLIAIELDRLNDTHYSAVMDDTLVSRSFSDVEDGVNRLDDRLCGAYQVMSRSPEIGLWTDAVGLRHSNRKDESPLIVAENARRPELKDIVKMLRHGG